MSISEMSDEEFFRKYTSPNHTTFFGYSEYFEGNKPPRVSIIQLLRLEEEQLKPFTKELVQRLEETEMLDEVAKAIQAYSQFQDILGITVMEDNPLINRHYCYYESLVYLRESIVSWLDNNILSAITLLRPFIELAVMHVYWHIRCEQNGYQPYYDWFGGKKGKTPFKNQLEFVFAELEKRIPHKSQRIADIKKRLQKLYGTISAYNHSPKVEESIVGISKGVGVSSLEGFFFFSAMSRFVFRQVMYMFILAYPMSIFPVDRFKKWGFSGPLGLYFDPNNTSILEYYIGSDNTAALREDLKSHQEVIDLLEHFNKAVPFTEAEIEASWEAVEQTSALEHPITSFRQRVLFYKAHTRGLGWLLNYINDQVVEAGESDAAIEKAVKRLETW